MLHFARVDIIHFFVAKLVVALKLFNGQNIIFVQYNFGLAIINLLIYIISFSKP